MKEIDQLIICSPYKEPQEHWYQDEETEEFDRRPGRRKAGYITTTNKKKSGSAKGVFVELPRVNKIRKHYKEWEAAGCPGMTKTTQALLAHWEEPTNRQYPFFFCQLEAIKTIIFLNEAPDHYQAGIDLPSDGGPFERWCSKMATGSGKTIVMSMLIAYNILNKIAKPECTRYTKDVLIVAPGLTVKERLSVLHPEHEKNYYQQFGVVDNNQMEQLRQGRIKIINWHMLSWDDEAAIHKKQEKGRLKGVDKRKQMEISDSAYAKAILGDMSHAQRILVINDEAHHAWRTPAEAKEKGKSKEEIDNTVWVGGLDKIHRKVPILRCHDFSATPFAPSGKKSTEEGLFGWIISDFGLNDAIESGLVKTPRVVFRDDGKYTSEYQSRLYHLYTDPDVKVDLNQKQIEKEVPLPELVGNAYDLLATDWLQTKREFVQEGFHIPPCMITAANTTFTANRIKHHFDANKCTVKELCETDKTLQIDSKILSSLENEDDSLTGSKAEMAKQLREKVNTVGKKGKLGEQIQNVISVGMLSEGWDANNVTQIMGLRAFSSQLLCEQVVGRGLRRMSYEFDEAQMLKPEYVNIFGIPFSFIPHEGKVPKPRPSKPKVAIEPSERKKDQEIRFPNILRVDIKYRTKLSLDYDRVKPITIDPSDNITEVNLGSVIEGNVTPSALTEVDLKRYADNYRLQSVVFAVATSIDQVERRSWGGNRFDFFSQLFKITEDFIQSDKIQITSDLFANDPLRRRILITLNATRIVQHLNEAIRAENANELVPVLDREKPIRSTGDMATWYSSKPHEGHGKSHINFTVFDSTWEANNANILNSSEQVRAYAKNDHLGFVVKYHFRGVVRNYFPDYIIHLANGEFLILEVKGQMSDENRTKWEYLDLWVRAVNQMEKFGKWHWAVVFNSSEIHDILVKYGSFPTQAFLPQNEHQPTEQIEERKKELATFFELDQAKLAKARDVDDLLPEVIKAMLSQNLDSIYNTVKQAAQSTQETDFVDEETFRKKIHSALDGLTPPEKKNQDARVRNRIKQAKYLHKTSLDFLVSAEYLNDAIAGQLQDDADYSPYVLQMTRAVENELLTKIFKPFHNQIREDHPNISRAFSPDFNHKELGKYVRMLHHNNQDYTLGQMHFLLSLLPKPEIVIQSQLATKLREFVEEKFSDELLKAKYLTKLKTLIRDYRNKSAHVATLPKDAAQTAQRLIYSLLNDQLAIEIGAKESEERVENVDNK